MLFRSLHERISDLELKAVTATENDARSQKQLKEMYERVKAKEKEMVSMREEIIGLTKQKQDALLKSTNLDAETSGIIKSLQRKVSQMNQERKTLDAVVQELTWKNEEIKRWIRATIQMAAAMKTSTERKHRIQWHTFQQRRKMT